MTETETSTNVDLDFMGNGSLADLMSKMGDIDKVLNEISEIDSGKQDTSAGGSGTANTAGGSDKNSKNSAGNGDKNVLPKSSAAVVESSYDDSSVSLFSDGDVYGDGGDDDVADLKGELMAADEADRQAKEERLKLAELKKQCIADRTAVYGTWEETVDGKEEQGKTVQKKSITVTLTKPSKDSPLGISMKTSKSITRIVSISDEGLLAGSGLKPGFQLKQVNGETLKNARHARHLIQNAPDEVKIIAVYKEEEKDDAQ
eukprot:CAMPEP_0113482860 /NCGR_PEP_ID=MMETSP0014_2-20120614/23137_1 /TAXON_ID=2857 /ORGANISM="Nitzschia sp." /LENGTH=258 /DNA_ID=CAMNT_0000376391 /DNA_START=147 /DNA_END=923 /DNA_ORIENTATION=+ /assembly_acc=CAM_ASM_000159